MVSPSIQPVAKLLVHVLRGVQVSTDHRLFFADLSPRRRNLADYVVNTLQMAGIVYLEYLGPSEVRVLVDYFHRSRSGTEYSLLFSISLGCAVVSRTNLGGTPSAPERGSQTGPSIGRT